MTVARGDQATAHRRIRRLGGCLSSVRRLAAVRMAVFSVAVASSLIRVMPAAEGGVTGIAEREVRRREALVRESGARLKEAEALLKAGKTEESLRAFSEIYQSLPKAGMASEMRTAARTGFVAASCLRARELMAEARYAEADELLANVLSPGVDPDNVEVKKLRAQFADPDRYPRALTPAHVANTKEVLRLLELANSAVEIGDYDKADATFQSVLRIDTYNKSARRGMERMQRLRGEYFDTARDQTRAKLLGDLDAQWEQQIPLAAGDISDRFSSTGGVTNVRTGREAILTKMREMIVPKVEFNGSTLDEVVEYLRVRSRDLDPKGRGVDFVINLPPDAAARPVTLFLEQVPLDEVLRYVTEKAGATFRVEDRAVVIVSISENSSQLIPKTYRVPPNFIQTSLVGEGGGGAAPAADPFAAQKADAGGGGLLVKRMGAREFLESRGVTFKEGASASYVAATNSLIVRNTPDNLAIIDQLVEQMAEAAPKQVLVSVRMLEVNQKNFDELRQDIGLGMANVPGSDRVFASGGGTAGTAAGLPGVFSTTDGLRPSGAILGQASIDSLLTSATTPALDSASPTAFQLIGVFTDPQFQVSLTAISQKKGMDLVSVPSVVTKSGVATEIEMVREFPYPTEFDPPQIPQNTGATQTTATNLLTGITTSDQSGTIPVVPTTPTAFETRKVGSLMQVETVVSPDGRQIELTLAPSTTEFEGFVNYGSDIQNTSVSTTFDPIAFQYINTGTQFTVPNKILQPIFRTNKLSTGVLVWDGSTIVVGGVISEKRQQITDKVPLLGDLPVIGKLWQNKVTQIEKKNVMFFVTVKVIDAAGQPIRPPVTTAQSPAQ